MFPTRQSCARYTLPNIIFSKISCNFAAVRARRQALPMYNTSSTLQRVLVCSTHINMPRIYENALSSATLFVRSENLK